MWRFDKQKMAKMMNLIIVTFGCISVVMVTKECRAIQKKVAQVVCNIKAPSGRKKTAPLRIVRRKYRMEGNKEQQSIAGFFHERFFSKPFLPEGNNSGLVFPKEIQNNFVKLNFLRENKATVIS